MERAVGILESIISEGFPSIFRGKEGIPLGFHELFPMKIIRQHGDHCTIKLSQADWQQIGDNAGWSDEPHDDKNAIENTENIEPEPTVEPFEPLPDRMDLKVEHYGERAFAVYANGELLCVTAYKRGAMAVKELVERLSKENLVLREMVKAEKTAKGTTKTTRTVRTAQFAGKLKGRQITLEDRGSVWAVLLDGELWQIVEYVEGTDLVEELLDRLEERIPKEGENDYHDLQEERERQRQKVRLQGALDALEMG